MRTVCKHRFRKAMSRKACAIDLISTEQESYLITPYNILLMKANQRTEWYNRPYHLTPEELKNPYLVIEEFFNCYHLDDLRHLLWDWLHAAMSAENSTYDDHTDRSDLLFFYRKIEMLAEAVFVLRGKPAIGAEEPTV